jgi:Flp pilus assembly protein TadG
VKQFRRFVSSDSGQGMVEFALSAALLLTMVFFIIIFGQAVYRYNSIASLAKDAARYASVHGVNGATVATTDSVQTYASAHAQGMSVTATTTWPDACCSTPVNAPGKAVQVKIETTFTPQSNLIPHAPLNLHSTAQDIIAR